MTTITDGAQSHGLNELSEYFVDICGQLWTFHRHFTGVVHTVRKRYLHIVSKDGKRSVVSEGVLDNVGHKHDINGIE